MSSFILSLLLLFATACSQDANNNGGGNGNGNGTEVIEGEPDPELEDAYATAVAFPELSFTRPVDLQHAGDNSGRLFVVEQRGVISVFEDDPGVSQKSTFLDIRNRVDNAGNEEGLLGLAFHPGYENNGYFYVNYTTHDSRTRVSRFSVSANDPNSADVGSEQVVLSFAQPYGNHNGGQVVFGPDGYLYITAGDGGSGGDPRGNGQDRSTLLGAILRIDVDGSSGGNNSNYAIPPDNPYAGNDEGYREEIYAWGLRNVWRFSFDPADGTLWAADVGQNAYEEIDIIEPGGNYGWNIMEGNHCYQPASGCDRSGLEIPVWEYGRGQGVSVTGGFVYRGPDPALEALTGTYVYADYASGRIWAFEQRGNDIPLNTQIAVADFGVASFGTGPDHELYICGFDGRIHRLERL